MTTTVLTGRVIRSEIENVLAYLLDVGIAVYTNTVREENGVVTWHRTVCAPFLVQRQRPTSLDYRNWLWCSDYSAILFDGSLIQISYEVVAGSLAAHRLAYIPCPFEFDRRLLREEPLLDVFDLYAAGSTSDVVLRSLVRFDFDPVNATPGHPASHLSINATECRIACVAPLRLGQFLDFILRHFYPTLWGLHPYFEKLPTRGWGGMTVTPVERQRPHLMWAI